MSNRYDAIIIGWGKGAKTLAGDLGKNGWKVAIVEKSNEMFGGTCINEGCIPTKFLVGAAEKAASVSSNRAVAESLFEEAMQGKEALVGKLRAANYKKLEDAANVDIYIGTASFASKHEVKVSMFDGSEVILEADKIMINTGSTSVMPPIKGIEDNPYVVTSKELLELKALPKQLVIIGGGYIGLEFASMFKNMGSDVTLVIRDEKFIPREDSEIADAVKESLENRGIKLLMKTGTSEIIKKDGYAEVVIEDEDGVSTLEADVVLLATGRKANTFGLNLEAAGAEVGPRGGIVVDKHRMTTADGIYAMGDVTGREQFTYISLDDYRIVRSHLLEDGSYNADERGAIPYSVFITPPLSRVGLTEDEAISKGYKVKNAKLKASAIPKAMVMGVTDGLLKVVVDEESEVILGAHLFMAESHEIINLMKLAIDLKLSYKVLKNMIFTHPTMSESINDLFAGM